LLAAWSTVWVELGRLPWLGLVAALLPASLAAALWLAAQLRDISAPPANSEMGTMAGLSQVRARTLFHGLLVLALAVPLLITLSGLDGAECFLPWLLAPLGEGPLRNTGSQTPGRGARAVRQLAVLLLASSALLAIGIWAG
jgi:1,4-dihydroxy-2-naphthoate octaprenyltransferase